jgi:23S rRNA pseudouridine1911/1915/1917 synthase
MKSTKPKKRPAGKVPNDKFIVDSDSPLLEYLIRVLPQRSRSRLKAVLKERQVLVNGRPVTQFDHPLKKGQKLEVQWERPATPPPMLGLQIIFEDADLIVVNKPPGLLTVATDKEKRRTAFAILSNYVKTQDPENKIFIVHRIDRETSGLLLFARNEKIKRQIQESWEETISKRTYVAVVEGEVSDDEGTITSWLTESKALKVYSSQNPQHGLKSITHYRKLRANESYSLLQLNLETGRKHQIRVHLQDLGHPVVGDTKYGSGEKPINRLALHAQVLAFTHPKTGELCSFETQVPPVFMKLFA